MTPSQEQPGAGPGAAGGPVAPDEVLPASPKGRRARSTRTGPGQAATEGGAGKRSPFGADEDEEGRGESVELPGKVMRIGTMVKQLLEEARQAPLDEAGRVRLREIYERSVRELATGLSPDLAAELDRMALPFDPGVPSESELRVAQAQLVGWLEGLFHGIQATLMAQQMAARAQLDEMRQRGLPRGMDGDAIPTRPGAYL